MNLLDDKIKIINNLGNPILLPEIIKNLGEPVFFNNIINPTIKPMSVFIDNNLTDKNTAHSYLDTYEKLFFPIRKTASNILEVGIYWGGSIQLWRDYFPYAQIYAVDICSLDFIRKPSILNDHNITLFTNTNGYDDTFIQSEFINKNIKFDMILDDGPHTIEGMINFIVKYLPLLSENGIMIIEDVQDFNWIEIFKQIVPNEYKKYIQVYDLRHIKNRYDDVLFVINKTISI
jgi:cephalosporin hydroxylase